jgi:hypothetical protein
MSKLSKTLVLATTFLVGALCGYGFSAVRGVLRELGDPLVLQDVSTERLRAFGVPFDRPPAAKNVTAAALSNGMGDVVRYVGLQLPRAEASLLVEKLQNEGVITRSDAPWRAPYLDQLAPAISARLWPQPDRQGIHVYSLQGGEPRQRGYLAFDPLSGELFVSTF